MIKVLIVTSVVSDTFAYSPGEKYNLPDAEALRLINGGYALKPLNIGPLKSHIESAAEAADYTPMPSGTAPIPTPSGGYFWDDDDRLHLVHPSGSRAILDPLHRVHF